MLRNIFFTFLTGKLANKDKILDLNFFSNNFFLMLMVLFMNKTRLNSAWLSGWYFLYNLLTHFMLNNQKNRIKTCFFFNFSVSFKNFFFYFYSYSFEIKLSTTAGNRFSRSFLGQKSKGKLKRRVLIPFFPGKFCHG